MSVLPEKFIERMAGRLGDELPAFLRSYEEDYCRGIRMNPMKPVAVTPMGTLNMDE